MKSLRVADIEQLTLFFTFPLGILPGIHGEDKEGSWESFPSSTCQRMESSHWKNSTQNISPPSPRGYRSQNLKGEKEALVKTWAFLVAQLVKNLPTMQKITWNAGDPGLIPKLWRSLGQGNDNPFQYSCLRNPMDRGAWQPIEHEVTRIGHDLAIKPTPPVKNHWRWQNRKMKLYLEGVAEIY